MSKVVQIKLTSLILVAETNLQRVGFADTKAGGDLIERMKESGWVPNFPATFAKASDLIASGVFSKEEIDGFKLKCQKARQERLDQLKEARSRGDAEEVAYNAYKVMFANGTDKVPAFGDDAVIINDGNQRANLFFDAEVLRLQALAAEAKRLQTQFKPEYSKTIPGEERKYGSRLEWFREQAKSNLLAGSRVNQTIRDRIKSCTEAFELGCTFEEVSRTVPAGDSRQRAPYAAYINKFTGGELLRRMQLDAASNDEYIAEGSIFATGLKDKMTADDRIQVVVAKIDEERRNFFKDNNEEEWKKALEGKDSKVPTSLIAIHNGEQKPWKKAEVMAWLDSITKKGLANRTSTPKDDATTKALTAQRSAAISYATLTGGETAEELVRGAVGNDDDRKKFAAKMEKFGPVLDAINALFVADPVHTTELADTLRGIDVSHLPAIVNAVKHVLKPAPQGGSKSPAKSGRKGK